ncbi:MAG: DNA gyrase inhibitor YacG [Pseudomonadales bacterium]|jgi:uncharacterized protein|uniref:DNA gyrase inhibitor YacG n=1 Tax=unclassified Ketobacter TaxID=2639109 RepID=UPI000C6A214A|nr:MULTISPECIES: DNA gyrase inhibitor YacG [unclassified Ketobacter]MAA58795.1 DNA gyrase inhibitor YacG [Pseudomonadales bacterium]MEC8811057.1 DNA gyrase inhibitor YacG [Pseudomonadota bacterium]TNC88309.1 MAG: DNA gyrase inhibitor YacG [Alcanivorax sp.]HAU13315.1 DNA gyrase inhibitor YacG [Gammaproteobacteria bacterium]MAQ25343.1 DNA gyrase inhibitor YacG [Pseudomonadales bacterium]|tara:strand:+ start:334 stop:522 length:189 start_codon:yes stop_codon:yes gene_type:complete
MKVKCPTCDKEIEYSTNNPYRPFCCERCKLIDLGEWASGERYIAGEADWSIGDDEPQDKPLH